ncbi:Putative pentatricopeptide repeat-containing protein At1g09680 [Linum grandiflorum]
MLRYSLDFGTVEGKRVATPESCKQSIRLIVDTHKLILSAEFENVKFGSGVVSSAIFFLIVTKSSFLNSPVTLPSTMMPPPPSTLLHSPPPILPLRNNYNRRRIAPPKFPTTGAVNSLPTTPIKPSSSSNPSTRRHNSTTLSSQRLLGRTLTTLLKDSDSDSAETILNQLVENGYTCSPPDVTVFTALVDCFCKRGKLQKAYQVVELMAKFELNPSIQTYNCLIKGLCYVGRVEQAFQLLADIKKTGDPAVVPDIYTYTVMMDGFCKVGRSDEAMELLDEAMEKGLKPNPVSFNALFHGYNVEGRPLEGMKLLRRIKTKGFEVDCVCYSTLLRGLLIWKEIRGAAVVYGEMVDDGCEADEGLMNNLLRGLCKGKQVGVENGLLEVARRVFDEMTQRGFAMDRRACDAFIRRLCRVGKGEDAVVMLNRMVKLGYDVREETMEVVLRALCLEGEATMAARFLVLMFEKRVMPSRLSYEALIDELNRQRRHLEARCVYGAAVVRGVAPRYMREIAQSSNAVTTMY